MTDTLIQTIARALWIAQAKGIDDPATIWDAPESTEHPLYWTQRMDDNRPLYCAAAQAALTAINEAGYCIVPMLDEDATQALLARQVVEIQGAITTGERNG